MSSTKEGRALVDEPDVKRTGCAPRSMGPSIVGTCDTGAHLQNTNVHQFTSRQSTRPYRRFSQSELREMLSKPPMHSSANPKFLDVINFPRGASSGGQREKRRNACPKACVMCGVPNIGEGGCFIRGQNKGVCTECDSNFWVHVSTGCLIKWCKGCKNFLAGEKFGNKFGASKCEACRKRVRTAYTRKKGVPLREVQQRSGDTTDGSNANSKLYLSPKPLAIGSHPDVRGKSQMTLPPLFSARSEGPGAFIFNPAKKDAWNNFISPPATMSPTTNIVRPFTRTIREAIAAMNVSQGIAITESPSIRTTSIRPSYEEHECRKVETGPYPSTLQQLSMQLEPARAYSQSAICPSPDHGLRNRQLSSNGVYAKAASLLGKDIVNDSMYLNGHVMQHSSPKLVAAPAADIMMSLVEDGDRQNESLNRSFDRLGFLVSLLGEEGGEAKRNKANGGTPSQAVAPHPPQQTFFDPDMDHQWAKRRKISPKHHMGQNVQLDVADNKVTTGECTSPLSGMEHRIPVQSV